MRPRPGQPPTWNWWLRGVMEDFYSARLVWDIELASASKGYRTEAVEYREANPCPQLKRFLRDHGYLGGFTAHGGAGDSARGVAA